MLMTFPGIVIVTARGKDVAAMDDKGQPIQGTKEYRVEGHKNLAYDASCWVRMYRDKPAIIVGARSVHAGIRPGKDKPRELDPDWSLEGLVFDLLQCDPSKARVRDMAELRAMRPAQEIASEAMLPETGFARVRELYAEAVELYGDEEKVAVEGHAEELLFDLLKRAGDEKRAAERDARETEFVTDLLATLGDVASHAETEALEAKVRAAAGGVISNSVAADLLQSITTTATALGQLVGAAA
jgi:hypothetical protein